MKPPIWLWDASDDAELPEDVQAYYDNDFDWMPLEYYQKENDEHLNADGVKVKHQFEKAIVKALYSEQYGIDAHAKYLDDAYGRGRWLRRIWRFASEGIFTNAHHRRIEQLDRKWTAYKKANGIEYDSKTLRVYSSAPLKDIPNGHANNMGANPALSGKNTVADATISDGEELQSVNLGQPNAASSENNTTDAPEQKLPRSKTFRNYLPSFKCSPS